MYSEMDKKELIELFVNNLVETNRGFSFYVNWNNLRAYEEFAIELNAMNVLIRTDDIKKKFYELAKKLPSFISTFPFLFALSKKEREENWNGSSDLAVVNTSVGENDYLRYSFAKTLFVVPLSDEQIEYYYDFFVKIGLKNLFDNMLQKSVEDYAIGVLCGLDSNGRKNRGGTAFEDACEPIIDSICLKHGITVLSQKAFKVLSDYGFDINSDIENRKADFILVKGSKALNIEVDYFFRGGSKPEEIINSYIDRKNRLAACGIDFVLLTDGNCWDNSSKSQLVIGFDNINIMNFYLAKNGYLEEIVKKSFGE